MRDIFRTYIFTSSASYTHGIAKTFFVISYFVENFKRESQSAAGLSHPNIVGVYDVGREGNINYIVMELVDGKTLSEVIAEEAPMDYKKVIDIKFKDWNGTEYAKYL
ncbi:MAG: hypothetical protein EOM18_17220, partial [Clostridia bacterium]|nr:hypothetical protein [Clostridia bacterium]